MLLLFLLGPQCISPGFPLDEEKVLTKGMILSDGIDYCYYCSSSSFNNHRGIIIIAIIAKQHIYNINSVLVNHNHNHLYHQTIALLLSSPSSLLILSPRHCHQPFTHHNHNHSHSRIIIILFTIILIFMFLWSRTRLLWRWSVWCQTGNCSLGWVREHKGWYSGTQFCWNKCVHKLKIQASD